MAYEIDPTKTRQPNSDRLKVLYDALKEDGADVGDSWQFRDWMMADENNRKTVWQAFKDDGADVGEYDEFDTWLFDLGQQPTAATQPTAQQPTQRNMGTPGYMPNRFGLPTQQQGVTGPVADAAPHPMAPAQTQGQQYVTQQGQGEAYTPSARVKTPTAKRPKPMAPAPRAGQWSGAPMQQTPYAPTEEEGNLSFMPIDQGDDTKARYDAERRAVGGQGGQVETMRRDIDSRLQEAYQRDLDNYGSELDKGGFWARMGRSVQAAEGNNPAANAVPSQLSDDTRDYQAAKHALDNSQKIIDEANAASRNGNFFAGAGRGMRDKFFDVSTWDFGITDLTDQAAIMRALEAYDKGEQLTESQQALLDAKALELATTAYFGSELGRGYKAGQVTAEAIPFMFEMAINPAAGIGKGASKAMVRYALKKFGKEAIEKGGKRYIAKQAMKYGTRIVGDVVGASGMTATTGAARTAADALDRMAGNLHYDTDEQGNITFDGHTDAESWVKAFGKAFASTTIENYSEMLGNYFGPALGLLGKGASKVGKGIARTKAGAAVGRGIDKIGGAIETAYNSTLSKKIGLQAVGDFISKVPAGKVAGFLSELEKRAQWHGVMGEYAEEVAGGILNALVVGDQTLDTDKDTGVFNLDNNIDTFLGVALMGGFFSGARTVGYGAERAHNARQFNKANRMGAAAFGDGWANVQAAIESDPKAGAVAVLSDPNSTKEQREAALRYAAAVTARQGMEQGKAKRDAEGIQTMQEAAAEQSYNTGYEDANTDELRSDINMAYTDARQKLVGLIGEDAVNDIDSDPLAMQAQYDQDMTVNDNTKSAIADYVSAKSAWDGVQQRINDDAADRADQRRTEGERMAYKGKGDMQGAIRPLIINEDSSERDPETGERMKKTVYLVNGNIAIEPNGNGLSREGTDKTIYVYDPETGDTHELDPFGGAGVLSVGDVVSMEDYLADNEQQSQAEVQQEIDNATGKVNVQPNTPFVTPEGRQGIVKSVEGDNVIVQFADGEMEEASIPMADMQQYADALRRQEYEARHPQQTPAEQPQQPNTATEGQAPTAQAETPTEGGNATEDTRTPAQRTYDDMQAKYGEKASHKVDVTLKDRKATLDTKKKALDKAQTDYDDAPIGKEDKAEAALAKAQAEYDAALADYNAWDEVRKLRDQALLAQSEAEDAARKAELERKRAAETEAQRKQREEYEADQARRKAEAEAAEKRRQEENARLRQQEAEAAANPQPAEQPAPIEGTKGQASQLAIARQELADDPGALAMLEDMEPTSLEEVAAMLLTSGKGQVKLLRDDFMAHTGYSSEDVKRYQFIFARKEKGGITLAQFGEKVIEEARDYNIPFDDNDAMVGVNAVLNMLSSVGRQSDINNYVAMNRIRMAYDYHNTALAAARARMLEAYGMTEGEYEAYMSWLEDAIEQGKSTLSDEEFNQLFNVYEQGQTTDVARGNQEGAETTERTESAETDTDTNGERGNGETDAGAEQAAVSKYEEAESAFFGFLEWTNWEYGTNYDWNSLTSFLKWANKKAKAKEQPLRKFVREWIGDKYPPKDAAELTDKIFAALKEREEAKKAETAQAAVNTEQTPATEQTEGEQSTAQTDLGTEYNETKAKQIAELIKSVFGGGGSVDNYLTYLSSVLSANRKMDRKDLTENSYNYHFIQNNRKLVEKYLAAAGHTEGTAEVNNINPNYKPKSERELLEQEKRELEDNLVKYRKGLEDNDPMEVTNHKWYRNQIKITEDRLAEIDKRLTELNNKAGKQPKQEPKLTDKEQATLDKFNTLTKRAGEIKAEVGQLIGEPTQENYDKATDEVKAKVDALLGEYRGLFSELPKDDLLTLKQKVWAMLGSAQEQYRANESKENGNQLNRWANLDTDINKALRDHYGDKNLYMGDMVVPFKEEQSGKAVSAVLESTEKIEDFGEKIGMARKDTATKGIKRGVGEMPAWKKKYRRENVTPEELQALQSGKLSFSQLLSSPAHMVQTAFDPTKPFVGFYVEEPKTRWGSIRYYPIKDAERNIMAFNTEAEYEAALPVFEVRDQGYRVVEKDGKYKIVRRASNGKQVEYAEFDTREDAEAYMVTPEGATSLLNRKRENFELPALESLTRNGMKDWRKGRNITSDDMLQTFGFRGGEFGNWLNAEERQQFLNTAYDALMDLAEALGVSPRALSLGGALSIAFGARGRQGARAHYEPSRAVINLTKMKGAGSLAHEWAHALDNYFGMLKAGKEREHGGENDKWVTSQEWARNSQIRKEIDEIFTEIVNTMKRKTVTRQIDIDKAQEDVDKKRASFEREVKAARSDYERGVTKLVYNRKTKEREWQTIKPTEQQLAEFDRIMSEVTQNPQWEWDEKKQGFRLGGELGKQFYELVHDVMPNTKGAYGPANNVFYFADKLAKAEAYLEQAKNGESETVRTKTDFLEGAEKADKGRAGSYYTKDLEMFARAFETYLAYKMAASGRSSDYLTYKKGEVFKSLFGFTPYPEGEELSALTTLFDKLFSTMQEYTDEQGNVMLYERADGKAARVSAKERKLRDAVVDLLRKAGIDVVTESEEGQRVLDMANGRERQHRVYHGSGADFERFDHSHMGEGEGAQSFGWGTYVTEVEGIGRRYARAMGQPTYQGRKYNDIRDYWNGDGDTQFVILQLLRYLEREPSRTLQEAIDFTDKVYELRIARYNGQNEDIRRRTILNSLSKDDFNTSSTLYTVEIPEDNGSNYLEWDKKVSDKQTEAIKNALMQNEAFRTNLKNEYDSRNEWTDKPPFEEWLENVASVTSMYGKENGKRLYNELSNIMGSEQAASEFLHSAGFVGIKYPAEYYSGGRSDGAKNYVIFNDGDLQITDKVKFFRTESGEAYGFTMGGKIYLDPRIATAETPIHEYTHLWAAALRAANPKAWERLKSELEKDKDLMAYVQRLYPELKGDELMDEVFAHFSGRRGAERLRAEQERMEGETRSIVGKAKVIAMFENLRNALKKFWNAARELFAGKGVKNESAEDFADMVLADLVNGVKPDRGDRLDRSDIERDAEYLEAVESGDMEKAQRMVNEAAKRAMPDTKVVDENGNPLVVYHGGKGKIIVFDKNRIGENLDYGTMGAGFYFTSDRENAENYARNAKGEGEPSVERVFINIRNIKEVNWNELDGESKKKSEAFTAKAIAKGYDGLTAYAPNRAWWYVAFGPSQIKSADPVTYDDNGNVIPLSERFNSGNADIRYQRGATDSEVRFRGEEEPVFYSNAMRAVENIKQERATPEQWVKMIEKQGGMKAGEDKWLGLSEWLKGSDAKTLTKGEVMDYIRANEIQIEEVEYAGKAHTYNETRSKFIEKAKEYIEENGINEFAENYGEEAAELFNPRFDYFGNEDWSDIEVTDEDALKEYLYNHYEISDEETSAPNPINSTRLQYTTEGLDNKREIVLTVPTIEPWNEYDEIHFGEAGGGRAVAWVRFGETTDADGKRVLVIDEIQSKRHQEGREKGYKDPQLEKKIARLNELTDKMYSSDGLPNEEYEELQQLREEGVGRASFTTGTIPPAPFEKNWHEVAMKRMLRFAAENGYDKVAWTKGEQQAERYGIGGVLDYIRRGDKKDANTIPIEIKATNHQKPIYFDVDLNGNVTYSMWEEFSGKNLSDIVGKEIANKLLNAPDETILEGNGLRYGGEGMKGFYDQILPRFMDKYGKKWGVKTGEVELPNIGDNGLTMWSVDVTDDMRESVMRGQPLFRNLEESDNVVNNADAGTRPLTDREKIAKLESEPKVKVYRSMQLIDGKLYPPMSARVDGQLREPSEIGVWEEAEEHPELADENGKFKLDKGNKKSLKAAYNPYIHTSRTMLNDQFSEAQSRPNLVVVEVEIPESELNGTYRAEKAKDSVGAKQWKAGVIQGQLSGTREVILSRWAKPVRIVPDAEVAENIARQIEGQVSVMPSNVVTPQVRAELEKRGVRFVETDNTGRLTSGSRKGETWAQVYGKNATKQREGGEEAYAGEWYDRNSVERIGEFVGYSPKQIAAMNARQEQTARNKFRDAAEKLHLSDNITFADSIDDVPGLTDKQRKEWRRKKGWYSPRTGKIVIILGNNKSMDDVMKSILHEGVAHHGLRQLFGEHFNTFLDNVYRVASPEIRERIYAMAKKHGWDFRTATEEYLAMLAEDTDFEKPENQSWWKQVKAWFIDMLHKIGFKLHDAYDTITDNELRYILWRSYENLVNPGRYNSVVEEAKDIAKQYDLKVGEWDETWTAAAEEEPNATMEFNGRRVPIWATNGRRGNRADRVERNDRMGSDYNVAADGVAEDAAEYAKRDAEYMEAVNSGDMEKAQRMVDEAAKRAMPDTKVVDENGNPLVVYHGTFDRNAEGRFYEFKTPSYFSNDEETAQIFSRDLTNEYLGKLGEKYKVERPEGAKGYVMPVFLDVKKPKIIDFGGKAWGASNYEKTQEFEKAVSALNETDEYDAVIAVNIVEGGNAKNGNITTTYAVKSPYQIKSADPVTYDDNGNVIPLSQRFNEGSDDIRFRDGEDEETGAPKPQARGAYERMVSSAASQWKEAMQDSMLSLKKLYQAVSQAYKGSMKGGYRIEDEKGYENAYLAENRMHSMSEAQIHAYQQDYMKPLQRAIHALTGGKREAYETLTDYMMAKHGLERNEVMAKREAKKAWEEQNKSEIGNPNYTAAKNAAFANIDAGVDDLYLEYRKQDYAGLTALTGIEDIEEAEKEAQRMVEEYEQQHDTTDLWIATNRATRRSLFKMLESGLLSPQRHAEIRDMYQYYIPLQGFDSDVAEDVYAYMGSDGTRLYGTTIRAAKGRKSKADDPIATIAMNGEAAIRRGNRNLMKQHFLRFVQSHPSDLVSINDVWLRKNANGEWEQYFDADLKETDTPEEVARKVRDFNERMEQEAAANPDIYKRSRELPNVPFRVLNVRDMEQHQVMVQVDGKNYLLTINGNPRAAQALNGLTNPDVFTEGAFGSIMNATQSVVRTLSEFYTTRNPNFVLSNFLRDAVYTNSMVLAKESPNYALNFHKNFLLLPNERMGVLFASWENGKLREKLANGTASNMEKMFYDFMMNGGETGWTSLRDIEKHKRDLQKALKREGNIATSALNKLGDFFDITNRMIENHARFTAYVTSIEMGRSVERAVWDAKEISVNFNKKGAGDKFLKAKNQTFVGKVGAFVSGLGRGNYAFWNASLQGLNNIARIGKRNPAKFMAVATTLMGLGVAIPLLNALLGGDDDDDKNAYWNLPEYVRRSNICFRFTKDMPWITIPLPIEFRAIYGLGELGSGVALGKEHYSDSELTKQVAAQFSQVLPLDFMEGGGGWHCLYPTWIKPVIEAYSNQSWTGLPIYRKNTYGQYDVAPEWQRAYSNTNNQIMAATKWLNEATGGDEVQGGNIDFNPARIEYMLRGYLGGYFTVADQVIKMGETATGNREFEWRNMMLANRVVKEGDERTEARKLTNEYFNLKEEYDKTDKSLKAYKKKQDEGTLSVVGQAHYIALMNDSEEYGRYLVFGTYKPLFDAYYKQIKEANAAGDSEEAKRLERGQNELRREMVNIIHDMDNGGTFDRKKVATGINENLKKMQNDKLWDAQDKAIDKSIEANKALNPTDNVEE